MSNEQLKQAYDLIKQGNKAGAIAILEPIIRMDRDNDNAWWLLANATDDPNAKRNALNNVLRLSNIESRRNQAQQMLQTLDSDPFDFDDSAFGNAPQYTPLDQAPPAQQSGGGLSCATITLIIIGLIGLCICGSGFAIYSAFQPVFNAVTNPDAIISEQTLALNEPFASTADENAIITAYTFTADESGTYEVIVDSDAEFAPVFFVIDNQTDELVILPSSEATSISRGTGELVADREYTVIIYSFNFIGISFGFDDYTIEVEGP